MKANVEWVVGVIRAGSQFETFGDPFEFSCTVLRRGEEAEVIGASGRFSREAYRAIRDALVAVGIRRVIWDRKRMGGGQKRMLRETDE